MVPEGLGSYNHSLNSYTGAIGLVQKGLADMVPIPVYYPLIDPDNEFFDYSNPIREDRMMMVCAYNKTVKGSDEDIMAMFLSVDTDLWFATLAGFITFILLLKIAYKILNVGHKYKPPAWMVTCAFLFEDNFPEDTPFNRVVTVTACVFLFFFGNYLLNSMSSDLIVFDSPRVIASYQDALNRVADGDELGILFYSGLPETEKFRDAPPGTVESKLWMLRREVQSETGDAVKLVNQLVMPIVEQKAIAILREVIVKAVTAYAICAGSDLGNFDDINGLFSVDPESKKYTDVIVFSRGLDPISKGQIIKMYVD